MEGTMERGWGNWTKQLQGEVDQEKGRLLN